MATIRWLFRSKKVEVIEYLEASSERTLKPLNWNWHEIGMEDTRHVKTERLEGVKDSRRKQAEGTRDAALKECANRDIQLDKEKTECEKLVQGAPPRPVLEKEAVQGRIQVLIAILLAIGGAAASKSAIVPVLRNALMAWLIAGGTSAGSFFSMHLALLGYDSKKYTKMAAGILLLVGFLSVVVLYGLMRPGQLAGGGDEPIITPGISQQGEPELKPVSIGDKNMPMFRLAMLCLALVLDGAGGTLFFYGMKSINDPQLAAYYRLDEINKAKARNAALADSLPHFVERAIAEWENGRAYAENLPQDDRIIAKKILQWGLVALVVLFLLLFFLTRDANGAMPPAAAVANANGGPWNCAVIELDLSLSSKSYFRHYVRAGSRVIARMPVCTDLTILGITDSFQPILILKARIGCDKGYFGEVLQQSRAIIVQRWEKTASSLSPKYPKTDIFSALFAASEILRECRTAHNGQLGLRSLYLLTDARHNTGPKLDLETPAVINVDSTMKEVKKSGDVANLDGVEVEIIGAYSGDNGKGAAYFSSLKNFWMTYFRQAKASVRLYWPYPEVPVVP